MDLGSEFQDGEQHEPRAEVEKHEVCLRNCTFRRGFPGGSDGKASAYKAGDPGLIPGLGRSLEKGMATHSSILAWRIPWTEEPGMLQSMGLQNQTQLSD